MVEQGNRNKQVTDVDFVSIRYLLENAENAKFFFPEGTFADLVRHLEHVNNRIQGSKDFLIEFD